MNMKSKIFKKIRPSLGNLSSSVMLVIAILLMGFIYSMFTPNFTRITNIVSVFQQTTGIFFLACGQTLMLLLGGIDLSQSAAVGLISVIVAKAVISFGLVPGVAIALLFGLFYGLILGLLVTKFHVQPWISSIGMMYILQGITYLIARLPVMGLPASFSIIGRGELGVVPINLIIFFVFGALLYYFLSYTSTGRSIYAIGGNEEVARLSGIKVDKVKIIAWMLNGFFVALGCVILSSRVSSGQPTLGGNLQNVALGAVVIGGTRLEGGHGGVVQSFLGVIFMSFLLNGFNLVGMSAFTQQALIGILIIAVVWFSNRSNRKVRN